MSFFADVVLETGHLMILTTKFLLEKRRQNTFNSLARKNYKTIEKNKYVVLYKPTY